MNNIFIEGPIQTGKSTLIRTIFKDLFSPEFDGVSGFTSQRVTDSNGGLLGFRLAPASAELSVCLDSFGTGDISEVDNVFKYFTPTGTHIDMDVFENAGIRYMNEALDRAKAGQTSVFLLDEIGGHELASEAFRGKLYELLDSEYPCVGVIKSVDNTRRMDPTLIELNKELHCRVQTLTDFDSFETLLRNGMCNIVNIRD